MGELCQVEQQECRLAASFEAQPYLGGQGRSVAILQRNAIYAQVAPDHLYPGVTPGGERMLECRAASDASFVHAHVLMNLYAASLSIGGSDQTDLRGLAG